MLYRQVKPPYEDLGDDPEEFDTELEYFEAHDCLVCAECGGCLTSWETCKECTCN